MEVIASCIQYFVHLPQFCLEDFSVASNHGNLLFFQLVKLPLVFLFMTFVSKNILGLRIRWPSHQISFDLIGI